MIRPSTAVLSGWRDPRRCVALVFLMSMFMAALDTTIVYVALPTITRDLDGTQASSGRVVITFVVGLAVSMPVAGWLADRWGSKPTILAAISVFTSASIACGLAANLDQLAIFRAVQGLAGGLLMPVGMGMTFRAFPAEQRIEISRLTAGVAALAPALGPVLGGVLASELSWRWIFLVNAPVGAIAVALGIAALPTYREPMVRRFDFAGFLLSAASLAALIFALTEGATAGWSSPVIVALGLAGVGMLAIAIAVETRRREPLLDMTVLRNRVYSLGTALNFGVPCAFQGVLYLTALFVQTGLSVDPLRAGLVTFSSAVGTAAGVQFASRIYDHVGPRRLIACAMAVNAAVIALLATVTAATSLWTVRALLFATGLTTGGAIVSIQAASFATITNAQTAPATTLFNVSRQVGVTVGVALLSTVLAARQIGRPPTSLLGYHEGFLAGAAISLACSALALLIVDADAEASRPSYRQITC